MTILINKIRYTKYSKKIKTENNNKIKIEISVIMTSEN